MEKYNKYTDNFDTMLNIIIVMKEFSKDTTGIKKKTNKQFSEEVTCHGRIWALKLHRPRFASQSSAYQLSIGQTMVLDCPGMSWF